MLGHCNSRQSNNFPASPPKMNTKSRWKILFMLAIKMKYSLSFLPAETIQLWFLELHDSPLELKGELQYLDENCHIRGEKMTILV